MAAEVENNIVWFTYTGQEEIPNEATHIIVDIRIVPRMAFRGNRNIVEVICLDKVERIEVEAFFNCPSLRRVIMPGVKIVEEDSFQYCEALTDVECGKLEIIKSNAFDRCNSLRSIDLPSVRNVESYAFDGCTALTDVKFGIKLERIEVVAFLFCTSLERITIPLKDGVITADDTFQACENLKYVDLIEGAVLHETVTALQSDVWRDDMNRDIDSINQILPIVSAGYVEDGEGNEYYGQKARVVQWWIRSVLGKIIHYKAKHQRILDEAAATLQLALPHEIVTNSVLPFLALALPEHTFEGEDEVTEEDDDVHNGGDVGLGLRRRGVSR